MKAAGVLGLIGVVLVFIGEYLLMAFLWNQAWYGTDVHAIVAVFLFGMLLIVFIYLDIVLAIFGVVAGVVTAKG